MYVTRLGIENYIQKDFKFNMIQVIMAVVAICGEPVSSRIPCFTRKIQGNNWEVLAIP